MKVIECFYVFHKACAYVYITLFLGGLWKTLFVWVEKRVILIKLK